MAQTSSCCNKISAASICSSKKKYMLANKEWTSETVPLACYSIPTINDCSSNSSISNGYLNVPEDMVMWVAYDEYDSNISNIVASTAFPHFAKYGFEDNPYAGPNFINISTVTEDFINSCYIGSNCDMPVFEDGFLRSPIPVIPYLVDTYVDTFKKLDIEVDIPPIKIPDIKIPDIKIPDITIPDIIIPDITYVAPQVLDIKIPEIVIPPIPIEIPEIKIPDIEIPDISVDIFLPDIRIRRGNWITMKDLRLYMQKIVNNDDTTKCLDLIFIEGEKSDGSQDILSVAAETIVGDDMSIGDNAHAQCSAKVSDWNKLFVLDRNPDITNEDGSITEGGVKYHSCEGILGKDFRGVINLVDDSGGDSGAYPFSLGGDGVTTVLYLPPPPDTGDDNTFLRHDSNGTCDWTSIEGLPPTNETGVFLKKISNTDPIYEWVTIFPEQPKSGMHALVSASGTLTWMEIKSCSDTE